MAGKGKPENFNNPESQGLTEQVSTRVTKEVKEAINAQENPSQFLRDAIIEKLNKSN